MKAGGAQFGSTSFTFFVPRILAPVAFGAQLCAIGAVTADAGGHAQMTRPSAQMIARSPLRLRKAGLKARLGARIVGRDALVPTSGPRAGETCRSTCVT